MHTCVKWEESSAAGRAGSILREESSPISGLAPMDLPRERLVRYGVEALKDYELLAIVLGTGYRGRNVLEVAQAILDSHPKEALIEMDMAHLLDIKGLGKTKASVLVAAFELARRGLQ